MNLLKVSENGHYLLKNGVPFFWMGDTLWPAPCAYTEDELEYYFKRRHEQGFNVIHIMITWVSFGGDIYAVKEGDITNNMPMWLNNDPSKPNDEYFKLVDMVVKLAAKHDMILVILPCGGGSGTFVGHNNIITDKNVRAYIKWVAERYKDEPHIIWANGFDLQPWLYENIALEFAAGIKESGSKQLMTYHPCGGTTSSFFHNEDWLDINFIQTWEEYKTVTRMVTADYFRKPYKPVIHVEGAYESGIEYGTGPITSRIVRRQAYSSYLSGGFHTYGHNDMWRKTMYWRECLDSKGANEMTVLKKFFTSFKWWKLIPDLTLFGSETWREPAAAISEDEDFAVIYFPSRIEVPVNIGRIGKGGPVNVSWIDPVTGNEVNNFTADGELYKFTSPACCDDAILFLRK